MKQVFENRIFIFFFLIVLSVQIAIIYISWNQNQRHDETIGRNERNQQINLEAELVLTSLKDVETGSRGFVISGDEKFLGPYTRAMPEVTVHFNKLRSLTAENARLSALIDSLEFYIDKRIDNAMKTIVRRRTGGFTSGDMVLINEGKYNMDNIRRIVSEIKITESHIYNTAKEQNNSSSEKSQNFFMILSVTGIIIFLSGCIYILMEITKNKNSEEELRELLDSAPDAIVVVNEKGVIEMVNRQTERLFGYGRREMTGENVELLIPGEYHSRHSKHRTQYFKDPNVRPMGAGLELYGIRKDETRFPVEISLSPLVTRKGKMVSAAIRDITEKKKVQEELHELNAELERKVVERTAEIAGYKYALDESCIVAITDQKGIIKYANQNFCSISRFSEAELLGQDHRIINSGFHSREFIRNLWTTIASGNIWRGELKNKAKDGTFYWVDTTIVPFLNNQGKPYQYVAIRSDITRRKQVEEELQQLNAELEDQVLTRTNQLEQVNEELEAFTYSVSHDLRAPLRIIDGYGDILVTDYKDQLDEEASRLLNVIMTNARHMGQLIDDLLNLSRLGRKDLSVKLIDMKSVVDEVISEHRILSSSKIKLIAGDLIPVSADATLIKQVWTNLISNAIKYSSAREESVIEIGSFRGENEVIYMVKDNGVGFSMDYSSKLFGVFQRLHKMSEYPGTGVGLAIVKRIITKHGGRVWANAEQDKGATFYFSVPETESNI